VDTAAVTESGVNPGNTPFAGTSTATGNVLTNDTDVDTGDTKAVSAVNGLSANVQMTSFRQRRPRAVMRHGRNTNAIRVRRSQ